VPGLLHHVGSKDGLLVAVLEHRDAEDGRSLTAELGVHHPSEVSLQQMCSALVRRNAAQPEIVRLFAVLEAESLAPSHPAHEYFAARQEQVVAVFAELAKAVTDEPLTLARQIVAMMDGLQIQWLRAPETTDLVREWEAAAQTLFPPTA
jgi:AcrR family transcriptional regulator